MSRKLTLGNSRDITSINGIEPPHPTKIGSFPLKTSWVESKTISLSYSGNSGAQKPSATSTTSKSIFAPNVSSLSSAISNSLSLSTTSAPFYVGASLIEQRNFKSRTIAFPAMLRLVGSPSIPMIVSYALHQLFR